MSFNFCDKLEGSVRTRAKSFCGSANLLRDEVISFIVEKAIEEGRCYFKQPMFSLNDKNLLAYNGSVYMLVWLFASPNGLAWLTF